MATIVLGKHVKTVATLLIEAKNLQPSAINYFVLSAHHKLGNWSPPFFCLDFFQALYHHLPVRSSCRRCRLTVSHFLISSVFRGNSRIFFPFWLESVSLPKLQIFTGLGYSWTLDTVPINLTRNSLIIQPMIFTGETKTKTGFNIKIDTCGT